jgi:hypothetical protein
MGHCYHHALSSVRKWGGEPENYLALHQWFDESKSITADFRIGEQHVIEDLGFIPSFADWVRCIRPESWMGRAQQIHKIVDPFEAIAA